ncbi:MAG: carboxypeptidase regulatory-like domain-containing protein [Bacteroidia bacterium]
MKKSLSSTRNMYQIVLNILFFFDAVWSLSASVASTVTSFRNKTLEIDDTAEAQQNSLKMYSQNKREKKRAMAEKALVTRGKAAAFASVTGDTVLFGKLKISFTKLFRRKDTTSIGYAETIYDAAVAMTPAQRIAYEISDQEILELRKAIDTFINLPSPIQMRAVRKQLTALLPELFKEGTAILTDQLDGLMEQYKESNPDFYNQYFNARRTFDSHRHTTIEGIVVDETTGADLQNVQVIITSDDETFQDITDVQAKFKQQISPEVNYKVKFVFPDYEPQEFENVNLTRGEHERLLVKLKKI